MTTPVADPQRRVLLLTTGVVGAAGLVATAVPFVSSLAPSEAARAAGAPVEFDAAGVAPGTLQTVAWRGKPVWIMRRTDAMVSALARPDAALADPGSLRSEQPANCRNPLRSLKPDLFVAVGICTHLGCSPTLRLDDPALQGELHAPGGFICPCHGSRFDLAGRVVRNVPAPTNLDVPPHQYLANGRLLIG
jgi:ubiquinol-cytochrome c reductase iron-sulfur subunit